MTSIFATNKQTNKKQTNKPRNEKPTKIETYKRRNKSV
jgi:hypothetical protein